MAETVPPSDSFACNACGAFAAHPLVLKKADSRPGGPVAKVHRCVSCHTCFLADVPEQFAEDLYAYYQRYRTFTREQLYPALTRSRYFALLDEFAPLVPSQNFLDVGCGLCGFVEAALSRGWSGHGIDLAGHAIEIGVEQGLPLQKQDFFTADVALASLGLVTMFEFIEHVPNPGAFLTRAEEVLQPGGVLFLTTPNFNSIDRYVLKQDWEAIHIEHLTYFTPRTLAELVRRSGCMEIKNVRTSNISADLLKRLLPRRRQQPAGPVPVTSEKQAVRHRVEGSPVLRRLKKGANFGLNITRLGSAMTMTLVKPGGSSTHGNPQ